MSDNSQKARELFLHAVGKLPPEQWDSYVAQATGGDAELAQHVAGLLQVHREAGSFLNAPAPGLDATIVPAFIERPGMQIGPYKLLQQIGEGGMGVVYMAEQKEPVERRVALKIIKPGMDTRQVIARFEAERQALAMMDHPNIAKVLDAGTTESGRPYFVMELVKGQPITQYCDEHHLAPRQRLELLLPVCQAIQHAHQKGIIHRDIKPTNILVAEYDQQAVPKVIDFGVAKAIGSPLTERSMFTGFGQIVGTLEYMSPEQAKVNQLDIDTRSDVYSLGVLLYELLTGSTPFDKARLRSAAFDEMLRIIREEEPEKPSTRLSSADTLPSVAANRSMEPARLGRTIRGELDWIVMKALEKDRNRRYETANGFAADIQRYLEDEPVQACPPSAAYRFRKFARRNKGRLLVASVLGVAILFTVGSIGWAVRDRAAREQEIALDRAKKLALTGEAIRQALDRGTKSRAELHVILKRPGGVQQLLNQPAHWELLINTAQGELVLARRLADRAEGKRDAEWTQATDQFEQQLAGDQADYNLARRLESVRLEFYSLDRVRFSYRNSIAEYEAAFASFGVLGDDPAAVAVRFAASPIREQLVAALDAWAAVERNKDQAERLLTLARQTAPDPVWGDRVRQLAVWNDRQALESLFAQAPPAGFSPQLLTILGTKLRIHRSALAVPCLRRAQARDPADFWLNFNLALALANTNPAEATGFYRAALAIRPGSSVVYSNLGVLLANQKRLDEAIDAYLKSIELNPQNAGSSYCNMGNALREQRKYAEAIDAYLKSIEIAPQNAGIPYSNMGNVLHAQGKDAEAIEAYLKALEFDSEAAFFAYVGLGDLYGDQKRWLESIDAYQKAIAIDPNSSLAEFKLGLAQYRLGNFTEAVEAYQKAIAINPNDSNTYCNLGLALQRQGKLDEAVAACSTAIQIYPKHANAHSIRGSSLEAQGKVDEAITDYRIAIELSRGFVGAYANLGAALRKQGKYEEAIAQFGKAIDLDSKQVFARREWALLLITCPDPKIRDPRLAVELAKKMVELEPEGSVAWQVLGWVQYRADAWRESIEALDKSCQLYGGGDSGQWTVLALAHAKLAAQEGLPEKEREQHQAEARRRYEQADKFIDSKWRVRPGHDAGQIIWDFREEARELMAAKENNEKDGLQHRP